MKFAVLITLSLYKSIQLHKASLRESGTDDSLFSLLRNLAILDWEKKNKFYEILMETATRRVCSQLTVELPSCIFTCVYVW